MSNEKKEPEKHYYDGIEEQDNGIPNWFTAFFLGGVLFGVLYFNYYELFGAPSLREEYARSVAIFERLKGSEESGKTKIGAEALLAMAKKSDLLAGARAIFKTKCVSCHGVEGQGGIGPNLTDEYWLHGGKITEIRDTITNGVLDKGMPPWGSLLTTDEVNALAAFVYSIGGTHPSGAKAPQGTRVERE